MSASRRRAPLVVAILGTVALIAIVAALLALAVIDYSLALALLIGVAAAWLFTRIIGAATARIRQGRRALLWIALIAGAAVVLLGGAMIVLTLALAPLGGAALPSMTQPAAEGVPEETEEMPLSALITAYRMTVDAGDAPASGVTVSEEVFYSVYRGAETVYADLSLRLPEREVASAPRGFLLREIAIEPLGSSPYDNLDLPVPDGGSVEARLCNSISCVPATIRLEDFPARSFFAARGVSEDQVEVVPYVHTETITWTTRDLSGGITFAYIPPPFQLLRPLLAPLVGASRASEWLVGLVGMVGAVLAGPFIRPVLENLIEDKIGELFGRLFKRHSDRKPSPSSRRK